MPFEAPIKSDQSPAIGFALICPFLRGPGSHSRDVVAPLGAGVVGIVGDSNMIVRTVRSGVMRCALAFLLLIGFAQAAEAEFIVNINGVELKDGGAGDIDSRTGFIEWHTVVDGYTIELTSSTTNSQQFADVTTAELRITNTGGSATPLSASFTDLFNAPPGVLGQQVLQNTLTRNIIAGLSTSGTVTSETTGQSQSGGGVGSTSEVTLTSAVDAGLSAGSFERTSEFYSLIQSIDITGLQAGHGVTITASSLSFGQGGGGSVVPAPASLALVGSGVGFLGLLSLRSFRFRTRK